MKRKILLFTALLIIVKTTINVAWASPNIAPFSTDGCSAFPDGLPSDNTLWLNCCITHDKAYWQGGTAAQRSEADRQLQQCVAQLGQSTISEFMHSAVRVGGSPYFPTSYRWGYGWRYPRFYGPLSEHERAAVNSRLAQAQPN